MGGAWHCRVDDTLLEQYLITFDNSYSRLLELPQRVERFHVKLSRLVPFQLRDAIQLHRVLIQRMDTRAQFLPPQLAQFHHQRPDRVRLLQILAGPLQQIFA